MEHTANNTEPTQKRITLKSALIAILVTAIIAVFSTVIIMNVNKAFIVDKLLLLTSIIVLPIIVLIFVIAPSDWISDLQN